MSQNKKAKVRNYMLAVAVAIFALAVITLILWGTKGESKTKVGYIMSGSMEEVGWNSTNYRGIKEACDELGLKLLVKENVPEKTMECTKAVKELARKGAKLIILSSYGYAEEMENLFELYPDVFFYCNSFNTDAKNTGAYFVRYYQARYLSGIVAGMSTRTGIIGYVAAYDIPEVDRGIDAFTLGVRSVNKLAKVKVAWSGTWDDAEVEKQLAQELIDTAKADVLTYHQNRTNVAEVAEENGVMSIGYHASLENASEKQLTAVICDWKSTYMDLLKAYLKGNMKSKRLAWLGLEKDVVGLAPLSDRVSDKTVEKVEEARERLLAGQDVFSGRIVDTDKKVRCDEGEVISDDVLLRKIDWFVKGVEFYNDPIQP